MRRMTMKMYADKQRRHDYVKQLEQSTERLAETNEWQIGNSFLLSRSYG